MAGYYVREEDGSSHYVLEDGSGDLLLEVGVSLVTGVVSIDAVADISVSGTVVARARVSQAPVEVIVAPTSAKARLSTGVVEVIRQNLYESVDFCIVEYRVRDE